MVFLLENPCFYRPKRKVVEAIKKVLYKALGEPYNAAPSQRGWGWMLEGRLIGGPLPSNKTASMIVYGIRVATGPHYYLFYCFY